MSIVVGTLTIDLTANTASFSQSMDKMSQLSARTANDIKRSLEKITLAGLAMGTAFVTGTAAMIEGSLDSADKMGKLAQATGTTSETLSVLAYAGKLAGVETEQLGKGLEKLSVSAFKAQNGNLQLQKVFARLGVSATDSNGQLKDSGVLMEQLAVKFAGAADGSGKTALAMTLFGKSGAALIPFLNQYGSEQARVNEEAHRFGLVLSTSTTDVAQKAHDNLDRLQEVLRGVGFSILGATLPALDQLLEKLIKIASDANIPDLAKAFGEKVVTAVTLLGDALEFTERHAHALKIALEALASLQVARIAIPLIGGLAAGGIGNVGKGFEKFAISALGLQKVLPVLKTFGSSIAGAGTAVAGLAEREGIVTAATLLLGEAFSGPVGWIALGITAVTGLTVALYKLRDADIEVQGSTYKLRDAWAAAGIVMSKAFTSLRDEVQTHLANIRKYWNEFTTWFSSSPILRELSEIGGALLGVEQRFAEMQLKLAGWFIPKGFIDALNQAKKQREDEASIRPYLGLITPPLPAKAKQPSFDTSGLGKEADKDPVGQELAKLDLAIAAQRAYLGVLGDTPEKIAAVSAEEKAAAIILQTTTKLIDEHKLAKGQQMAAADQAAIRSKVTEEESLKALVAYGNEIVSQQHSAELSIQTTRAMAAANLEGDAAVRAASIDNAILALRFNRVTGAIEEMTPRLKELQDALTTKASTDVLAAANKETDGLRDQLEQRRLITRETLGSIDAQRQAALTTKVFKLNENIADPTLSADAVDALKRQRDAVVALTQAEWAESDAQAARALMSPQQQYEESADSLNHAVEALKALQGGTLTYAQQLGIAMKAQDEFNKATDETVNLLLHEGSLGDGVEAFFLKMQQNAKTAASTIFEVMNDTFNKLSDNLTQLITAPNRWKRQDAINAFAGTFEGVGKTLMDSAIKQQMQTGLSAVGKAFNINLGTAAKIDGSTSSNALWVRWASANGSPFSFGGGGGGGNELDNILGGPPNPQSTFPSQAGQVVSALGGITKGQAGPVGIAGSVLSMIGKLFGMKQPAQSSGALGGETLGLPTGPNELDSLLGPASIPQLLRRPQSNEADTTIPSAPDVQPKTYSQITIPQPSALGGVLQSLVGIGSKLFGGLGFANGGMNGPVRGAGSGTSDSIHAMISNGEFITKASSTAKYLPLLHAINNDSLKLALGGYVGFDEGGMVSPSAAYLPASMNSDTMRSASSLTGSAASSSRASAGDNHHWIINVPPGANDPAQMTAHLDRYMRTAGPQWAAVAVRAVKEERLRQAPSAR